MSPNILLIILDAARANNFSPYGHTNETAPYISTFIREATLYAQARSPSTWSLPSHVSMFTGLEVPEHEVRSRNDSLIEGNTVWKSLANDHGYDTAVFSENPFITADSYGIAPDFDEVITGIGQRRYPFPEAINPNLYIGQTGEEDVLGYLRYSLSEGCPVRSTLNAAIRKTEIRFPELLPEVIQTSPGNTSAQYANAFLDWQAGREQWAACLNLTDAHYPYEPIDEHDHWGGTELRLIHDNLDDPRWDFYSGREPWWKRTAIESLYDGCLHQLDATVREIVETLEDRNELADTLVVITSDHGEGFGEPSRVRPGFRVVGHAGGIHECLLHVPLIVKFPRQVQSRTIKSVATLTRFPDVVSKVVEGENDPTGFSPDGPVVAVSDVEELYLYPPKNFEDYRDEMPTELFSGCAEAVYEDQQNGSVRKYVTWNGNGAIVDCFDAQNTVRNPDAGSARDVVTSTFNEFEDRHVRKNKTEREGNAVRRRLKDLGYI